MTTPYEYEIDQTPMASDPEDAAASPGSFLDRARALAARNAAGRPAMRVSGARVGDATRPVEPTERRLPAKRLGLRVHASAIGRRAPDADVTDDSGEGVA